jgi:peroxiredoxin
VNSHPVSRPRSEADEHPSEVAERLRTAFADCLEMDGPLAERLSAYAAASREIFPAYGLAVDNLVERLEENGGGRTAPAPGQSMPPFMLPDETGRFVELEALLADGPVAIMFHRGHWCPYCRMSVDALVRSQNELRSTGGQVVVITPERQQYAKRFKSNSRLPFPILTDLDNGYALSLGLAIWLGLDIQQLLSHRDLPDFHGNDAWMVPIPATFVVGTDGVVKARFIDPDFRHRMEIDSLLSALRLAR